eukprot:TRINITY_DN8803_c0_g1_i1.p1 TRINITY_DN8803_c0_g1~~TRINITY_DN8803_c0_g1_i1.p1  ORF type:complete len:139 (+),score=22.28 TRINITY_DN8803_c0_g1_i1:116-532(+)
MLTQQPYPKLRKRNSGPTVFQVNQDLQKRGKNAEYQLIQSRTNMLKKRKRGDIDTNTDPDHQTNLEMLTQQPYPKLRKRNSGPTVFQVNQDLQKRGKISSKDKRFSDREVTWGLYFLPFSFLIVMMLMLLFGRSCYFH